MISKSTVKYLVRKYNQISGRGKIILVRHVLQDSRYIDKGGNLLGKEEVNRIEKEDEEVRMKRGRIVNVIHY